MSSHDPRPKLDPKGLHDKSPKDFLVRFVFGAAISLMAALIGLRFPELSGVFLAFPAILPASLTLVERDGGRHEAEVNARGAIIGAFGLLAFAVVVALAIKPLGAPAALALAGLSWVVVAVGLYMLVMALRSIGRRKAGRAAPG